MGTPVWLATLTVRNQDPGAVHALISQILKDAGVASFVQLEELPWDRLS